MQIENRLPSGISRKSPPALSSTTSASVEEPSDTLTRAQAPDAEYGRWKQLAAGAGLLLATGLGSQAAQAAHTVFEIPAGGNQITGDFVDLRNENGSPGVLRLASRDDDRTEWRRDRREAERDLRRAERRAEEAERRGANDAEQFMRDNQVRRAEREVRRVRRQRPD